MKIRKSMNLVCGIAIAAAFALSLSAASGADAGKATYNDSCVNCHGPEGAGSAVSDTFWKMKIPRLNSDYVQKKSDEELTEIILNGKRKMPPAMVGKPDSQHKTKVTPAQVPDLIAYIRTLKLSK
jgi:mono/diheme cytochrome c family protein